MDTRQIQALLVYLGYDPGEVDGIPGRNTRRAVLAFQAAEGLTQDGSPGPLTQAALLEAVANGRFRAEDAQTPEETTGTWWDSIRYFTREEKGIACPCGRCGGFPVDPTERLMRTADSIREELGPMIPSSTVRCQAHNDELQGSAKNSRHIYGKAMDFNCPKSSQEQIEACLSRKKTAGEIRYWYRMSSGWYHFDVE